MNFLEHSFVCRSVDTKQAFEVERVQAIRFIRKVYVTLLSEMLYFIVR